MSIGLHNSVTCPSCSLSRHATWTFSTTRRYRRITIRVLQRANFAARKQNIQIRAGLLSIFMPTKSKQVNKAVDLVNELLETASRTDGGASTSQDQRTTIRDLAEQLRGAGGVQNPVYSDLVWGEYEVTYASRPQAAGGPFLRSAPGKFIFSNQKLRQTLIPTDNLVNSVSFRALGIFPGNAIQDAVIETLSGTMYKLTLQPAKIFGVQLGPSKSIERVFDVLYLDEKVRVVEFLPDQSPNSNSSEPVLFVLRRLSNVQHPESGTQVFWNSEPSAFRACSPKPSCSVLCLHSLQSGTRF
ncbi:TPA: hypothetical protein ACH3X1_007403 [Trebouxia sp. C0004]